MKTLREEAAAAAAAEKTARDGAHQFDNAHQTAKTMVQQEMDLYADESIRGGVDDVLQWWFQHRRKFLVF